MTLHFEKHAAKGNEFLNLFAQELGGEQYRDSAGRILRSTFRALRKHLMLEESFHLISQLPLVLKGVYVDGWQPQHIAMARLRHMDDFLEEVIREDGLSAYRDFSNLDDARFAVKALFRALRRYVSEGEMKDIRGALPKALSPLFEDYTVY